MVAKLSRERATAARRGTPRRRLLLALLAVATALLSHPATLRAPDRKYSEYQVKAAFLYNFASYVEWPERSFADAKTPITIGILGDDPFGDALERIVARKEVNGRRFSVRHFSATTEITGCHILFVSESESDELETVLRAMEGLDILLTSDIEDFTKRGGHIGFITVAEKIRLTINLETLKRTALKVSSQLIKVCAHEKSEEGRR